MRSLHILLSNDDGILAPGLLAQYDALVRAGHRVTVVAPLGERSASSHAISVWRQFPVHRMERDGRFFGIALDSTPADCVKFAMSHLLRDDPPELVIGGINPGPNIGDAVFYSGTVAVAAEGALYGLPAIAVSLGGRWRDGKYFEPAADFVVKLIERLNTLPIGPRRFLNVNVPNEPAEKIRGVIVTRQGVSAFADVFEKIDTRDDHEIWANQGNSMRPSPDDPGLDDRVLEEACISITPMRLDITDHAALVSLHQALRGISPALRVGTTHDGEHLEHIEEMSPFPVPGNSQ